MVCHILRRSSAGTREKSVNDSIDFGGLGGRLAGQQCWK
jgi:hypothetical protein